MFPPKDRSTVLAKPLKTSPTDSTTSGYEYSSYELNGETGIRQSSSTAKAVVVFPKLEGSSEQMASDIGSLITSHLVRGSIVSSRASVELSDKIAFELRDFVNAVDTIIGQDEILTRNDQCLAEMIDVCTTILLKTHRLKTEWMEPCRSVNLSIICFFMAEALYDIPNLRDGGKYFQNVEYHPNRFRRAMKLDSRLRNVLTQARDGDILTEDAVVTMIEDILEARMTMEFPDEMQDCTDGRSFDFSKCKDLLTEDQSFLLYQLAQYHGICARVSHLSKECYCRSNDMKKDDGRDWVEKKLPEFKAPEFEFVSWCKYGFPASMCAITGHVREAKQRVFSLLEGLCSEKKRIKEAVTVGFVPTIDFLKEYATVGWKFVPKEKLIAGLKLEKAYQELALVNARALHGISALTAVGVVREALENLEKLFVAEVDKKNSEMGEGEKKLRYDRESFWDFVFSCPEGELLKTIMVGEYGQFAWEGLYFCAHIKRRMITGEPWMDCETPVGITVNDKLLAFQELNFLQAVCKFHVVKLRVIPRDKIFYSAV